MVTLLAGCLASLSCTQADNANTTNTNTSNASKPNTNSAATTTPAKVATPDPKFNLPYEAVRDTGWTSNPNPPPPTTPTNGTVVKGTKVFFDHVAPVTPTWQIAMFEDGSKKYVHPDDFKKL
jgi:hypothetical protein